MAPVYGNMVHLCLLCANTQDPEDEPLLDVYGQRGKLLKISDKIHKFLTIKIEPGFPHHVCISCVCKLELFHEFVQYSEKAYLKFKTLQIEWEARQLSEAFEEPMEDMDDSLSQIDVFVPSPESTEKCAPVESQDLETNLQPQKRPSRHKKFIEEIIEKNQSREFPMLEERSLVVKGSQLAIFVAEEDPGIVSQYKLGLVLINTDAKNKERITEQVDRIMKHAKKRLTSKKAQSEKEDQSSTSKLLHSCQSCKCSFFLQEEMVSHFESLHPEQVYQCTKCDEKICGPVQMQEKHKELHRALEKGETDDLLSTLQVPSSETKLFHPEFVVVELGDYRPHYLKSKTEEILQSKILITIRHNIWVKPDMKDRLSHFLEIFISKVKLHLNKVQKPKCIRVRGPRAKVECDICGRKMNKKYLEGHIESKHNPQKVQCCHCKLKYLSCNENSHIESHHNGGKNLLCKICDSKYSESGKDQPHMAPKSDFPFKCPTKRCRKAFQSESNLEKHMQMVHKATPPCLCDLCGKVYKSKPNLKAHLQAVHFPRKDVFICDICGATYSVRVSLSNHKEMAHRPKVACEVCGRKVNKRHLANHMKTHTEEPSIPCKYCGRLFSTALNCNLHEQKRHEGVKLYCSICTGMSFKTVKTLEEHMSKHERGEEIILPKFLQPVQCSICSEMLDNSLKLAQHIKRHKKTGIDGILPKGKSRKKGLPALQGRDRGFTIPCYACLIRFMTQDSYDNHVETHHPEGVPKVYSKPPESEFRYQCRHCDKTFRKKDFCNDHETLHGGEKQHACDYCGKKFSYYADKWAHQKRKCPSRPQTSGSN